MKNLNATPFWLKQFLSRIEKNVEEEEIREVLTHFILLNRDIFAPISYRIRKFKKRFLESIKMKKSFKRV